MEDDLAADLAELLSDSEDESGQQRSAPNSDSSRSASHERSSASPSFSRQLRQNPSEEPRQGLKDGLASVSGTPVPVETEGFLRARRSNSRMAPRLVEVIDLDHDSLSSDGGGQDESSSSSASSVSSDSDALEILEEPPRKKQRRRKGQPPATVSESPSSSPVNNFRTQPSIHAVVPRDGSESSNSSSRGRRSELPSGASGRRGEEQERTVDPPRSSSSADVLLLDDGELLDLMEDIAEEDLDEVLARHPPPRTSSSARDHPYPDFVPASRLIGDPS